MAVASDRNLLYGIMAWQNGLITESELLAGLKAWSFEKNKPLGEHLVAQAALSEGVHHKLDRLVNEHLDLFDGDATRSLAVLSSANGVSDRIFEHVEDPEVQQSLTHLCSPKSVPETITLSGPEALLEADRFQILRELALSEQSSP